MIQGPVSEGLTMTGAPAWYLLPASAGSGDSVVRARRRAAAFFSMGKLATNGRMGSGDPDKKAESGWTAGFLCRHGGNHPQDKG